MDTPEPVNVNILRPVKYWPFLVVGKCYTIPKKYADDLINHSCAEVATSALHVPFAIYGSNTFERPMITLPQKEMDVSFVDRLSKEISKEQIDLFFEPSSNKVIEITEWHDAQKDRYIFGKRFVDALRLKAILENRFTFYIYVEGEIKGQLEVQHKSPTKGLLDYTMSSPAFQESLRHLDGVYESPFLYILEGQLKVTVNGYNPDCCIYIRQDAPEIKEIDVNEAKKLIDECLLDFPFQIEQDKTFAISAIITPMLRGIYGQYGVRTPVYGYLANQQGCGKDYLAGIRQIIYTGKFNEDAPLSNDKGSNSDEVQKEFVAAAITGQQFMHNSNCRGRLENAAYEKQVTSASIRGRTLSTNIIVDSENILENSFSGNYGLTFNKDIARRTVFINLFTDVEDTTQRKFTKNLHQWIKDNRGLILSAIYTLIKSWWDAGHKMGEGINASYPTWAAFCSGVMSHHDLGDPCAKGTMVINDVGGDTETKDISRFNRELGDWLYDENNIISSFVTDHKGLGLTKKDIFSLFQKLFQDNDDRPFPHYDLDNSPKDRREFGRTINKYIGTYRGGYKLIVFRDNPKLDRVTYKFVSDNPRQSVSTVPTVLTLHSSANDGKNSKNIYNDLKVNPVDPLGTNSVIRMVK